MSDEFKDYYELLGLYDYDGEIGPGPEATPNKFTTFYREKVEAYHPINILPAVLNRERHRYTQEFNEAYKVLKDPKQKAEYDKAWFEYKAWRLNIKRQQEQTGGPELDTAIVVTWEPPEAANLDFFRLDRHSTRKAELLIEPQAANTTRFEVRIEGPLPRWLTLPTEQLLVPVRIPVEVDATKVAVDDDQIWQDKFDITFLYDVSETVARLLLRKRIVIEIHPSMSTAGVATAAAHAKPLRSLTTRFLPYIAVGLVVLLLGIFFFTRSGQEEPAPASTPVEAISILSPTIEATKSSASEPAVVAIPTAPAAIAPEVIEPTPTLTKVIPTPLPIMELHPGELNLFEISKALPTGWDTQGRLTYWEGYIHIQDESAFELKIYDCGDNEGNGRLDTVQVYDPNDVLVLNEVNCNGDPTFAVNTNNTPGFYRIFLQDNDTSGNGGALAINGIKDQIIYPQPGSDLNTDVLGSLGYTNYLEQDMPLPTKWGTAGEMGYWLGYLHVQDEPFIDVTITDCGDDEGNGRLNILQITNPDGEIEAIAFNCAGDPTYRIETFEKPGYYRVFLSDPDTTGNGGDFRVKYLKDERVYREIPLVEESAQIEEETEPTIEPAERFSDWEVQTYQTDDFSVIVVDDQIGGLAIYDKFEVSWTNIDALLNADGPDTVTFMNVNLPKGATWGFGLRHEGVTLWGKEGGSSDEYDVTYLQTLQLFPDGTFEEIELQSSVDTAAPLLSGTWELHLQADDIVLAMINDVPIAAGLYDHLDWIDISSYLHAGQENTIEIIVWNYATKSWWDLRLRKDDNIVWGMEDRADGELGEVLRATVIIDGDGNIVR